MKYLISLALIGLVGCNNYSETIANQKRIDELKIMLIMNECASSALKGMGTEDHMREMDFLTHGSSYEVKRRVGMALYYKSIEGCVHERVFDGPFL